MQRLANIKRNQEILAQLGLKAGAREANTLLPSTVQQAPAKKRKKPPAPRTR